MINKIYVALYNFCIHESASGIISLHTTKDGAKRAAKAHRQKEYRSEMKMRRYASKKTGKFCAALGPWYQHQWWGVVEYDIEEN